MKQNEVLRLFSIAQDIAADMLDDPDCADWDATEILLTAADVAANVGAEQEALEKLATTNTKPMVQGAAEVQKEFVAFALAEQDHYAMIAGDGGVLTEAMPEAHAYQWEGPRPDDNKD